jgi:alkylated DNA repair dioxygenase AlkB
VAARRAPSRAGAGRENRPVTSLALSWQPSLFAWVGSGVDASFAAVERIWLDDHGWADFCPEWMAGSDAVFEELLRTMPWGQRRRWRYERDGGEARLTSWHKVDVHHGGPPPVLEEARAVLSGRYGVVFDSVGVHLHLDGTDTVPWHRDRLSPQASAPVTGLVALGGLRTVALRPRGGGAWRPLRLGHGDLLVTGGATRWRVEHRMSRRAHAGPRMSIAFRHPAG